MADCRLPKDARIRKRSEYLTIYQKGAHYETRHFRIAVMPNRRSRSRIGITVSRKVGSAVQRNHVKRRLKEYFRQHTAAFPPSSDIIITARAGAQGIPYADVCSELESFFCRTDFAVPHAGGRQDNAGPAAD